MTRVQKSAPALRSKQLDAVGARHPLQVPVDGGPQYRWPLPALAYDEAYNAM